jgi:hypothetical protein
LAARAGQVGMTTLRTLEEKPPEAGARPGTAARPRGWLQSLSIRGFEWRIFITLWLIYLLHASPFVTREQYLTMALVEDHSVRVDKYADLHPDLITIPGRGTYLGNNPGISLLAAIPYAVVYPAVRRIAPVRPAPPGEEVKAETKELRPMRLAFYKKVRQRGLDVRLAVVALFTAGFFMAPLTAAAAVLMFRLLLRLGHSAGQAAGLALLFGLGTPMFFRAATMNQNLLVALLGVAALALVWWPWEAQTLGKPARFFLAGLLGGWAVVSDYTGVITLMIVGLFVFAQELDGGTVIGALRGTLWAVVGGAIPGVFMLLWQQICFGSPWYPAQFYLPKQVVAGYPSTYGFGRPLPEALWGLLFDPLYGLLVFAPVFGLALYHPVVRLRGRSRLPSRVVWFTWIFTVALWVFCSCIHYTVRHQWQDGVRYIVPAVPFLFLLVAEVLREVPRIVVALAALAAIGETWCLSMVRENPLDSMVKVLLRGFELPWLTTLVKTASQYYPPLADGASPAGLLLLAGIAIAILWRLPDPGRHLAED